jgi:biotin transport system substrate-specific component
MSKAIPIESNASVRSTSLFKQAGIVVCASAVIAVCARLVLPLPFTPVPLTLANFGVLLVGLTLGSRRGFAAAGLYLAWGAMGLPVFASFGPGGIAQMLGPTAGYLWAYPVVAFLAGWIAERGEAGFARNLLGAVAAEVLLFAAGLSWLAAVTHSWQKAALFGLYPFLFAEVSKIMVAAAAARRLRTKF